ncbi:MAG: carboxypeptidase-like regulatory domain-containing protein, partial [Candidatus Hatepunaea meridiana]|nr:carboxypeptidase-like regulatory domain-containing protein [Candidatus Hatepunaea meridiana]
MFFKQFTYLAALIFAMLLFSLPAHSQVTVDPIGMTAALEADEELTIEMTLTNSSNSDIEFSIKFDEPPEDEERHRGPRRDDPDLEGMMFAIFQDGRAWDFMDEVMMDPILDRLDHDDQGDGYHTYRNANDWDNVEFEDYDVIVVAACNQSGGFVQQYNENLERFCDYIDGGGSAYFETGDGGTQILSPGGIRNQGASEANGRMVVTYDPDEDNYSLFADICHESQGGNLWGNGHVIQGSQWTHSEYALGQFEDNDDIDWFEVIAVKQNAGTPGAISYTYGRGCVLTQGGPTGYNWRVHPQDGRWGSIAAEILFYLTEMTGPKWILAEPEEGVIEADDAAVIDIIFQPIEIEAGVYEMRILIELAEPEEERDDLEQTLIEISAVMSLETPAFDLTGVVTDEATDETVEGVTIEIDRYVMTRYTDDEGAYSFENLPAGEYELTFTATDYLTTTEGIEIEEDDVELDIALLHSECTPSEDEFFMELNPDMEHVFRWEVTNGGNGPLVYSVERQLLGDANTDP